LLKIAHDKAGNKNIFMNNIAKVGGIGLSWVKQKDAYEVMLLERKVFTRAI